MVHLQHLLWLAGAASAQFSGWTDDQINTSICLWPQPRVALIQDTIYIDGGDIHWTRGLSDGQYSTLTDTGNAVGRILTYNLTKPFDADTNVTGILIEDSISKAIGGSGNAGNAANFVDGGALANYYQFIMYGGAMFTTDETGDPPDGDEVLAYMAYQYGSEKGSWERGFNPIDIDNDDVTRYVTYGAAVSAPSENKAWYFSGMTSPSHGHIQSNADYQSSERTASEVSNRMIEVNMETQLQEEWRNLTLRGGVKGRAGAEGVWVPVGEQGILVFLGGVTHPAFANTTTSRSDDEEASKDESPEFMSTIDIYDIANDDWHRQETSDGPDQRARGCAVVAPAQDYSSFNIYYYGGFDGLNLVDAFYDSVWVLSLPSFTWTELNEGSSGHGRAGHKCVMPYSDQMMVIGGEQPRPGRGGVIGCLDPGPIVMFNLTSGDWMNSYHPEEHANYGVPSAVLDKIGGDPTGGATLTTPSPSGWDNDDLEDVFSSTYETSKISTFGPWEAESTESGRPELPGDDDDNNNGGGGGLPNWVGPVLGVVLGLMLITAAIVIFCLWRRRKSVFKNRSSDYGTEDPGNRVMSWIKGQPTEKAGTVTSSDDTPMSPEMMDVKAIPAVSSPSSPPTTTYEAAGTPIAELDDTSPPVELSDTGLTPVEIIQKHTRLTSEKRSHSHQSYSSFSAGGVEYNSNISRSSLGGESANRPDSPSVPNSPEPGQSQGQMQSLSETLAKHDTQGQWVGQQNVNWRPSADRRVSDQDTPISPPSAGEAAGEDYINARGALVSPLRRSVFHENEEDLGKK